MSKGFMYFLKCADNSYYTGSTKDLERRLLQHQNGECANHTKKRLPVELFYYETFDRIDDAFYREKQVQGWSRKKKKALINGEYEKLPDLSIAYRDLASPSPSSLSRGGHSRISECVPSSTSGTNNTGTDDSGSSNSGNKNAVVEALETTTPTKIEIVIIK